MGLDRGTSGGNRRLQTSVLEPRIPLRRARLKKGVRAGRLQSTKVVWDSLSGLFCSGSDARRQTAHRAKGLVPGPGTEGGEEGANREDYETKEEARE